MSDIYELCEYNITVQGAMLPNIITHMLWTYVLRDPFTIGTVGVIIMGDHYVIMGFHCICNLHILYTY